MSNLLLLKVQNAQTFQQLLSDVYGCSSKAFHIYMILYRPLLHREAFQKKLMCLQSGQTH